jgi:hypothetical protein
MKRCGYAFVAAALLLAGCGDKAQLQGWCEKRIQEKGSDSKVNCECFAKTIIGEPSQSQERKDTYKALMSVVPLYAAGKDEEADAELNKKGLRYRIGAAALIASGALQCVVVDK